MTAPVPQETARQPLTKPRHELGAIVYAPSGYERINGIWRNATTRRGKVIAHVGRYIQVRFDDGHELFCVDLSLSTEEV